MAIEAPNEKVERTVLPKTSSRLAAQNDRPNPTSPATKTSSLKRVIFAIAGITILAIGGATIARSMSATDEFTGFTHKIERGDVVVTVTERGILSSAENTEIKCKVRGKNTVTWVIENGSFVMEGDVLVTLDTLLMEEQIAERSKYSNWSRAGAEWSKAHSARSKIAIKEFEEGRYETQLAGAERDLVVSQSLLKNSRNWLQHTQRLADRGFATEFDLQQQKFSVRQAELDVEVKETQLEVLKNYAKEEELQQLKGNHAAAAANHEANAERAIADSSRRDRAVEEMKHCVVRAEKSGIVIYPSSAKWLTGPDITEGATVHMHKVLLLMPDMSQMQVELGVNEAVVDKVKSGMSTNVTLANQSVQATVSSVASVARPAEIWTGNVVKYSTIIDLPSGSGLKPGMSADVEIVVSHHKNVLRIPVAAVVDTDSGGLCWVKTRSGIEQRTLELGDSNGVHTVVMFGLKEGDEVVLNPAEFAKDIPSVKAKDESEAGEGGEQDGEQSGEEDNAESSNEQQKPDKKKKYDALEKPVVGAAKT